MSELTIGTPTSIPMPPSLGLRSFGRAIALSRNGRTLLVGGRLSDERNWVGVFENSPSGAWSFSQELAPSAIEDTYKNGFGESIGIAADGRIAAVTTPQAVDDFGASVGGVVIFHRLGGRWHETATITGAADAPCGSALAVGHRLVVVSGAGATYLLAPGLHDGWANDIPLKLAVSGSVVATAGDKVAVGALPGNEIHVLTPRKVDEFGWGGAFDMRIGLGRNLGPAGLAVAQDGSVLAAAATLEQSFMLAPGASVATELKVAGEHISSQMSAVAMVNDIVVAETAAGTVAAARSAGGEGRLNFVAVPDGASGAVCSLASDRLARAEGNRVSVTSIRAASGGMPDVYVRDNFGDDGRVPVRGSLFAAPDIICRRAKEMDPHTAFVTTGWDRDLFEDPKANERNYLYVRARNRGTAGTKVMAHLFSVPAASFISHQGWEPIGTIDLGDVAGGARVVNADPLVWQPAYQADQHRCFVAALGTTERPFTEPSTWPIATYADWDSYVMHHNWLCFHNSNVAMGSPGSGPGGAFDMVGLPHRDGSTYRLQFTTDLPAGVTVRYGFAADSASKLADSYRLDGSADPIRVMDAVTLGAGDRSRFRFTVEGLDSAGSYSITFTQFINAAQPMGSVRFAVVAPRS